MQLVRRETPNPQAHEWGYPYMVHTSVFLSNPSKNENSSGLRVDLPHTNTSKNTRTHVKHNATANIFLLPIARFHSYHRWSLSSNLVEAAMEVGHR